MFTGIVQCLAEVKSVDNHNELTSLVIQVPHTYLNNLATGASVAINGVCLTVVEFSVQAQFIRFDVIDETLRLTNLAQLKAGSRVNLERSLKFGDEVGGHMVSGHIHGQATLQTLTKTNENCALKFECEPQWAKYIMHKGFIGLNGASLTLGDVKGSTFWVHLIPETLSLTNLSLLAIGDTVNIEYDQSTMTIVNTIERMNLTLA